MNYGIIHGDFESPHALCGQPEDMEATQRAREASLRLGSQPDGLEGHVEVVGASQRAWEVRGGCGNGEMGTQNLLYSFKFSWGTSYLKNILK